MGGGEEKTVSSGSTTQAIDQTQQSNPWAPFANLIQQPGGFTGQLGEAIGTPQEAFGGQTYASMSPQEQAALNMREGMGGPGGSMEQIAGQTHNAWTQALDPSAFMNAPGAYSPLDLYSKNVGRNIDENVMPGINNAAIGTGNMANSRAGIMEGLARRGGAEAIADYGGNLTSDLYQRGMTGRNNALGMAPMVQGVQDEGSRMLQDVGRTYGGYEQQGIDEDIRRHEFEQNEPWQRLQRAMPMLYGGAGLGGTQQIQGTTEGTQDSTSTQTSKKSPFETILPMAMMAGGAMFGGPLGASVGGAAAQSMMG